MLLYSDATVENEDNLKGWFIGPRREMITPWSTNAVEITQNMGLNGIRRIEEYFPVKDEMLTTTDAATYVSRTGSGISR